MARGPKRTLKVFQARLGFYETLVAVPSQAAALKAWGVYQNLFKDGTALPVTDPMAIKAALQSPGIPLRRPIGSTASFSVDTDELPDMSAPSDMPSATKKGRENSQPHNRVADRSALNAAEAELHDLERQWRQDDEAFQQEQAALAAITTVALSFCGVRGMRRLDGPVERRTIGGYVRSGSELG